MANRNGREALRGHEVETVDAIFKVLSSEQWEELLKAPLEWAVTKGNRCLAQQLVRAGAEIGDALHQAVRRGHGEIVNDLLESGASLDAKDTYGCTPLHAAAEWDETKTAQLLLLKGADKDAFDSEEGCTPLYLAVYHGNLATALALLAAGADASLRCGEYMHPVINLAVDKGHVEILRAMVEHGADVEAIDIDEETALHAAALNNNAEVIDVLVGAGANIEARTRRGRWYTPLHCASDKLNREALLCLLKHGANVNAMNDTLLTTSLMLAAAKASPQGGAAAVVDSLLRAGADETIVNECECGPSEALGDAFELGYHFGVEDVKRVDELLNNAPADRTWRRRGYLVLCRAHPDRMPHNRTISGTYRGNTTPRTRSHAKLARAGGIAANSRVDESASGDWAVVVAKLLGLQEDDIFRTIVGYL